jgi:MFS family permease
MMKIAYTYRMQLKPTQRQLLVILALINFFNYLDRNIIFPLFHLIKMEFGVSDFQLGLLGTLFLLVHSVASVPLGILADRYSRKVIVSLGVLFWSVASFATGIVGSFKALLAVRGLVGIGEASYAPAATAMISDNFPESFRGQAQGIFNVGLFLGGTLGAIIGGLIAFYFHSWRLAFLFVSLPGVFLSLAMLKVEDKQRHHVSNTSKAILKGLFLNPAYIWMLISGTLISFAAGGFITWGVEYIMRYRGYDLRTSSLMLGGTLMVAGVIGVLLGSYLADRLHAKFPWGRAILVGLSLAIGAPFMLLGVVTQASTIIFMIYFFVGILLTSFYHGPSTVVMHDIVPTSLRASAYGFYLLIIHLLGDTTAPVVIGAISDRYSLRFGLELAALAIFVGGVTFLPICWYMKKKGFQKDEIDHTPPLTTIQEPQEQGI